MFRYIVPDLIRSYTLGSRADRVIPQCGVDVNFLLQIAKNQLKRERVLRHRPRYCDSS